MEDYEKRELAEMIGVALTQAKAAIVGMAEDSEWSDAMAKLCRNYYSSFIEVGFSENEALQLTVAMAQGQARK